MILVSFYKLKEESILISPLVGLFRNIILLYKYESIHSKVRVTY
jgi:hypothetical protein